MTIDPAPLGDAEFAALLDRFHPFGAARQVVVAVSGGADSMALALLLRRWGQPLAVVVDHGLRAGSAQEAEETVCRLTHMGIPARPTRLCGLAPGPDLGARARASRYQALLQACRETGLPDLFVAHHRQDQAETVLLRAAAGSGPAGLAGMAAVSWRGDARILRPLLTVDPARLRATLRAAGTSWAEDPTNHDPSTARGGLRALGVPETAALEARINGASRAVAEAGIAAELAVGVTLFPTGHALTHGPLSEQAWSALVWMMSGRAYPPPRLGVRRLARVGEGTLHGVQVRRGLVVREAAALGLPVPAWNSACWDGRFVLRTGVLDGTMGALGAGANGLRGQTNLPSVVLRTLPAVRTGSNLLVVKHLAYPDAKTCLSVQVDFRPTRPLAGAPFLSA